MTARSDNFNRADAVINGSTPSDGGAAWTASSNNVSTLSNQAGPTAAPGARETQWLECSASSGDVSMKMVVPRNAGPLLRLADANNHIIAYCSATTIQIYKRVGGSYTQLGSTYTGTVSANDVIKLTATSANALSAYQNGTLRVGPVTDSAGSTNTKAGFEMLSNGTTDRFDDWSWADAAAASTSNPAMCAFPRAILNF